MYHPPTPESQGAALADCVFAYTRRAQLKPPRAAAP